MRYFVTVEGRTFEVEVDGDGVVVNGEPARADLRPVPGTDLRHLLLDGRGRAILARSSSRGAWDLHVSGRRIQADVVDERTRAIRERAGGAGGAHGPEPLRAPMPGLVLRVEVEPGQQVTAGQGLVIIEAMKMENELRATTPAVVSRVRAQAGEPVEKGAVLIEFGVKGKVDGEDGAAR